MTFSPTLPFPMAIWDEPQLTASVVALALMTAYLLTDGSVEFLAALDPVPAGAIAASVVDGGGDSDEIVSPAVTTGRRIVEGPDTTFLI